MGEFNSFQQLNIFQCVIQIRPSTRFVAFMVGVSRAVEGEYFG